MSAPRWIEVEEGKLWEFQIGDPDVPGVFKLLGRVEWLTVSWEATVYEDGEPVVSVCFVPLDQAKKWVRLEARARWKT